MDVQFERLVLEGLEALRANVDESIAEIRKRLKLRAVAVIAEAGVKPLRRKKHKVSAEGRERMAAAQRKRWAKARGKAMAA